MAVRGLRLGLVLIGAVASGQAVAATPHPALTAKPIAAFAEVASGKKGAAKILYYKNEDVIKTTSVTVKTPIYTTVTTPVYTTVRTPIYNSHGVITGYKTTQVQTGTTTSQKISGYNSVTTKSTAVTPKSELYTTNGTSTAASAAAVKFVLDVPGGAFAAPLSGAQDALFTFSALSTHAAVLDGDLFSQTFDTGTMSFKRATPLYHTNALGKPFGAGLDNLLTITFQNAVLTATKAGVTIGFAANTPDSTINFTSDFRNFVNADFLNNFNFALSGNAASTSLAVAAVDPTLTNVTGARTLSSFRVSTTGTFAASDVPEPASWMMLVFGFGVIGLVGRADLRKMAFGAL